MRFVTSVRPLTREKSLSAYDDRPHAARCRVVLRDFTRGDTVNHRNIVPLVVQVEPPRLSLHHAVKAVVRTVWAFVDTLDSKARANQCVEDT